MEETVNIPAIFPTFITVMSLSLIPFLVVMGTAFAKISIVLMLLRNALGTAQAPSGLILNSIAISLTAFIMVPVVDDIIRTIRDNNLNLSDWDNAIELYGTVAERMGLYLKKHATDQELAFFMDAAHAIWPEQLHRYIHQDNIFLLLPAHAISEITRAFEIAFLLFIPFLVIDMVVSNILLAMGAMMVPPNLVALPMKILLFVASDGWSKLLHALILSYI